MKSKTSKTEYYGLKLVPGLSTFGGPENPYVMMIKGDKTFYFHKDGAAQEATAFWSPAVVRERAAWGKFPKNPFKQPCSRVFKRASNGRR